MERRRVTHTFIRGFKEADFVKTMDFVDEAVEIAKAVQVSKSQCYFNLLFYIFILILGHYSLNPSGKVKEVG